jgi:predicted ATPase
MHPEHQQGTIAGGRRACAPIIAAGVPPDTAALSAAQALTFPAVQLFVDRATAGGNQFELNDSDARVTQTLMKCR